MSQVLYEDFKRTLLLFKPHSDEQRLVINLLGRYLSAFHALLLQQEAGLPLRSPTSAFNLRALQRFNQLLFIGLLDVHDVTARHAFENGGVQAWAHAGNFGRDGVNGDQSVNVVGAELGHRADLVGWQMHDANKRKNAAGPDVEHELLQRTVGCIKMQFGLGQNVLGKFVVVAFDLTVGDVQGFGVGPQL